MLLSKKMLGKTNNSQYLLASKLSPYTVSVCTYVQWVYRTSIFVKMKFEYSFPRNVSNSKFEYSHILFSYMAIKLIVTIDIY